MTDRAVSLRLRAMWPLDKIAADLAGANGVRAAAIAAALPPVPAGRLDQAPATDGGA